MRQVKPVWLCLLLLCVGWVLTGCSMLSLQGEKTATAPNLGLLEMEPYQDTEVQQGSGESANPSYLRVDIWLDASQVMGGINPSVETMYPHTGRKYREGGFHYRYGSRVGWYENVLSDMLSAAEGSRVRVLRVGNERLTDSFLYSQGLVKHGATGEDLASLRRDLLTYAIDPLSTLFTSLSAEDMAGSFYTLGSPKLNQMSRFLADNGAELENPGQVQAMSLALDAQISAIAEGGEKSLEFIPQSTREDNECPLFYALDNMDLTRLNVIPFDPAGLRRLSGTDVDGKPVAYFQELLSERGVFEKGLCVGLYAFQLDYMGQMATVGAADLSEPLIWGKPIYNSKKRQIDYVAPMPRILLALVIGDEQQVEAYMGKFSAKLKADTRLQGLRGPEKGELTYTQNSATVVQQPFSFAFWETTLGRPQAGYYTQHTQGASLTVEMGKGQIEVDQGLNTVLLAPTAEGKQEDRVLTLRFPLENAKTDAKLDLSELDNAHVEVMSALLLTETLENTDDTRREAEENEQIVPLRDRLYVYTRMQEPFLGNDSASPFTLKSIGQNADGSELICTISVKGEKLKEGYYRVCVSADITAKEVLWLPVDWIDGANSLSVSIGNEDIARFETFTAKVAEVERSKSSIPKNFQHAWGSYTGKKYQGLVIPDCPPVYKAMGLGELTEQLREAAKAEQSPYVRYVFDVFVDNVGTAAVAVAPAE